jgi:hypothetical protein
VRATADSPSIRSQIWFLGWVRALLCSAVTRPPIYRLNLVLTCKFVAVLNSILSNRKSGVV